MPCVVVPATPLLVQGAAGAADPLAAVRRALRDILATHLGDADRVVVLGTGPRWRSGRLRPTLATAGIADVHVPALARLTHGARWDGPAALGASVALLALADAGADLGTQVVHVVEIAPSASAHDVDRAATLLRPSPAHERVLVVVAEQPAPGVDAVVAALTGGRPGQVTEVAVSGEHLPDTYRVTSWGASS